MTKPIIVVKIRYKLLYVIQVVKKIFDISNFLTSTDVKVFDHTYLFTMLSSHFLHPGCFCLVFHYILEVSKTLVLARSREVLGITCTCLGLVTYMYIPHNIVN